MVKWNEYTWYSKWASLIFFILILPILTFYIGTQYQEAKLTNNLYISQNTEIKVTSKTSPQILTYTNKAYGWSFQYPSDWRITESKNGSEVTVESNATTTGLNNSGIVPVHSYNFSTIKKADFGIYTTRASGDISYDSKQDALVHSSDTLSICLSDPIKHGAKDSIVTFYLDTGSPMNRDVEDTSTSAIITDKDYIITVNSDTYGYTKYEESELDRLNDEQAAIYSSFKLADGVNSIIPTCSKK